MKRALLVLALGVAATVAALAAPAFSLERWRAEPVSFELAAPGGRAISEPLRSPKRFNLVGLRWRGRSEPEVAIRTRRDGGEWSPWTRLDPHEEHAPDVGSGEPPASGTPSPAWVGEADWVQYRLSRRVPGLRLHFVNVNGTATAADRARSALRRAVNAGLIALAGGGGASARAAEQQPAIVPREEWAADDCTPRRPPEVGEVRAAFVHHTVSTNNYTAEQAPQVVLGICDYHRNSNGWNDIGYNFLVDKYGVIYEGRAGGVDQAIVGAQAQGYNAQSTGIANIGTHTSVRQTPAALGAIARLIRWKLPLHGVGTAGSTTLVSAGGGTNRHPAGALVKLPKIAGHRDTNATECPGDALYGQLPDLRALVGDVPPAGNGTRTSAGLKPPKVSYGGEAQVSGRVRSAAGEPLAGAPVEVQAREGRRWATLASATTGVDGVYLAFLRPARNRVVRARFPGDGFLLPSASSQRLLGVRPLIGITRAPRRGRARRRVAIAGTVAPRKRRLYLVLQLRRGGVYRKLGVRPVPARRGRFATSFVPAGRGSYRFYLAAKADATTVRGASEKRVVRVGR